MNHYLDMVLLGKENFNTPQTAFQTLKLALGDWNQ
jgi:hypothetical protein